MPLKKQLQKVSIHLQALEEYKRYIEESGFDYSVKSFQELDTAHKAVFDAYLKRFSSLQDYLGAKVFKSLLEKAGIGTTRMSEVLTLVEKEEIIDLDQWIEFRNLRNDLEHDYPDELEEALEDLRICVENFESLKQIVSRVFQFARRYDASV